MAQAVHTITATEHRLKGFVIAIYMLCLAGTAGCVAHAWPLNTYEWISSVAACLILANSGSFLLEGRSSVGMIPLSCIALGLAGATAHILPLALLGLICASVLIIFFLLMHHSYAKTKLTDGLSTILVLGCAIRGNQPSFTLARRLDVAYKLWTRNPTAYVLVSGGTGTQNIAEANVMSVYLLDRGIPDELLLVEDKALNTEQNIAFSLALLNKYDIVGPVAVVSSDFHLYRTCAIAQAYGHKLLAVPAKTRPQSWLIQWSREVLVILEWRLRSFISSYT